jgi:Trk K+ transport system NAD-binding subunit
MSAAPVVIIGGGRVGRAVGRALHARDIDYRIVEMKPELIKDPEKYVQGNAADRAVLDSAGILKAPAVVITTHDDDLNVYLSIYCRGLRPDVQIVTRAVRERTVAALTRAGVDFVVSDASMGATTVFNLLRRNDIILVAEGLHVFRLEMPPSLIGKTIAESNIRQRVGCSVVSVRDNGETIINPGPSVMLNEGAEIALIGTVTAEDKFIAVFVDGDEKKAEAAPAVM